MKRQSTIPLAAVGLTATLAFSACSSSGTPSPQQTSARYDAALRAVVNPSTHRGGTIIFENSIAPDSTDPGNTYYAYTWNTARLYGRTLVTYKSAPAAAGLQLVPDLATSLGTVSDHGLAWTYHLKPGIKFEDGTPVTSQDVKYAVERTYDRSVLPLGPSYFPLLLAPQNPAYPGPYKDRSKNLMGLKAVQTPNPNTIVFYLAHPFADFNYVTAIPQTVPVPPGKDTGADYQRHPVSTGPYMFASYQLNKQFTLVKNPNWDPATDPNRKQLADTMVFNLNVHPDMIDANLMHNFAQVDQGGFGVQAAARAQILASPQLKHNADNPLTGFLWFAYINTKVKPLDNVHCRRAVEYATDKTTFQTAFGGPIAGGDIASTVMPPTLTGYRRFDLYHALTRPHGDLANARQELAACGQSHGFTTTLAYATDSPKQTAAATAEQQALARAGITLTLRGYSTGTFYDLVGTPTYVHQHGIGLAISGWAADWPDGLGFLYNLTAGPAIQPTGNTNIEELNDPVVNGLFTQALATSNAAARSAVWAQIDRQVMADAVILPGVYGRALLYRNPHLTNVYMHQYYAGYDYANLGLK